MQNLPNKILVFKYTVVLISDTSNNKNLSMKDTPHTSPQRKINVVYFCKEKKVFMKEGRNVLLNEVLDPFHLRVIMVSDTRFRTPVVV